MTLKSIWAWLNESQESYNRKERLLYERRRLADRKIRNFTSPIGDKLRVPLAVFGAFIMFPIGVFRTEKEFKVSTAVIVLFVSLFIFMALMRPTSSDID